MRQGQPSHGADLAVHGRRIAAAGFGKEQTVLTPARFAFGAVKYPRTLRRMPNLQPRRRAHCHLDEAEGAWDHVRIGHAR